MRRKTEKCYVHKATTYFDPDIEANAWEGCVISVTEKIPSEKDNASEIHAQDAKILADILYRYLPTGTFSGLLREMYSRQHPEFRARIVNAIERIILDM